MSNQHEHWVKDSVRALAPAESLRVDPSWQRLHWNENPSEFPADLKETVLERLAQAGWTRYPLGLRPWALIEAIAARRGLAADQVVVGAGSSDLIKVVLSSVLRPGDVVVMPTPTFLLYRPGAQMQGAHCIEVPLRAEEGFALPVETLCKAAADHAARLVIVCAPNNPTGTVYDLADLERLAHGCPSSLLLVDAAYAEFSGQDFTPLLASGNVLLLHTFSKLYALAGARIGYALAPSHLAGDLQKAVSDFPLSVFAEIAAQVAIENAERFQPLRQLILAERERLAGALAQIAGLTVHSSGTNFLLVQLPGPKQPLLHHLLHEHGVLLSDLAAYPELNNCVRVSIGSPQQNDRALRGFADWASGDADL